MFLILARHKNNVKIRHDKDRGTDADGFDARLDPLEDLDGSSVHPELSLQTPAFGDSFGNGGWRSFLYPSLHDYSVQTTQKRHRRHSYCGCAATSFDGAGYLW